MPQRTSHYAPQLILAMILPLSCALIGCWSVYETYIQDNHDPAIPLQILGVMSLLLLKSEFVIGGKTVCPLISCAALWFSVVILNVLKPGMFAPSSFVSYDANSTLCVFTQISGLRH